jgi:hypothetical protein
MLLERSDISRQKGWNSTTYAGETSNGPAASLAAQVCRNCFGTANHKRIHWFRKSPMIGHELTWYTIAIFSHVSSKIEYWDPAIPELCNFM